MHQKIQDGQGITQSWANFKLARPAGFVIFEICKPIRRCKQIPVPCIQFGGPWLGGGGGGFKSRWESTLSHPTSSTLPRLSPVTVQPAIASCNEDLCFFAHFKHVLNYQSRFGVRSQLCVILTAITGHKVSQNIPRLKDPVRLHALRRSPFCSSSSVQYHHS